MPLVVFEPSGISAEVASGTALLHAARSAGVPLETPCGGEGTCAGCKLRLVAGQLESVGSRNLPPGDAAGGHVLACSATVGQQSVTVWVPEQPSRDGVGLPDAEVGGSCLHSSALPAEVDHEPITAHVHLTVPPAQAADGLGDLERFWRALGRGRSGVEPEIPLGVLRSLAERLRADRGRVTVSLSRDAGCTRVIAVEAGHRDLNCVGAAIDLGTTTVAVRLISLPAGAPLAAQAEYNAQIECGLDVIGRINYARKPAGLEELRHRALATINGLLARAASQVGIQPEAIVDLRVSGNTVMVHLLLGLDPQHLRVEPYTPTVFQSPRYPASALGLAANALAPVSVSPCVGSYVGGDITAGLLLTDLAGASDQVSLFMDIGTNGELVVGNRDFLMTCACSAGPAFEGGGIECGMRAAYGAIDRVTIDGPTGAASYSTIGGGAPRGICGSGMISLLANLYLLGWIDAAGKLDRSRACGSIRIAGRRASYQLAAAGEAANHKALTVSEIDIENTIRAKAAVYSACSLMLAELGVGFADLSTVYIAGGFGRFVDIESAQVIGLLPDLPRERFKYLGNASLEGTALGLVSRTHRERQAAIAQRMTYLELNTNPAYMDRYTGALFLPHTDLERFPSVLARRQAARLG